MIWMARDLKSSITLQITGPKLLPINIFMICSASIWLIRPGAILPSKKLCRKDQWGHFFFNLGLDLGESCNRRSEKFKCRYPWVSFYCLGSRIYSLTNFDFLTNTVRLTSFVMLEVADDRWKKAKLYFECNAKLNIEEKLKSESGIAAQDDLGIVAKWRPMPSGSVSMMLRWTWAK